MAEMLINSITSNQFNAPCCRPLRPLFFSFSSSSSTAIHFLTSPTSVRVFTLSFSSSPNPPLPSLPEDPVAISKMRVLKEKMELLGIIKDDYCAPGLFYYVLCPKCKGGNSVERSLSLHIIQNGDFAMWRCFRTECGWTGQTFVDNREASTRVSEKLKFYRQLTEESLGLEPLGDKLISYLSGRMISKETLRRNAVMQVSGDQSVIAFTYRRNGLLVGCKYRTMAKRYWQEKGTEKTLYGYDDMNNASEIIIVEGELDKLSFEEAGFGNCVSVPGGAPSQVSAKAIPSKEKDIAYQYLWNCRDHLDQFSRIILATDSDKPGQALAEELARRLGKHRCWRVHWPKKDESSHFKDANEVLMYMGPDALKKAIQNAVLY